MASASITIGPGPALGTDRRGQVWFEEFQDWKHSDLRSLDPDSDQVETSFPPVANAPPDAPAARDIVAFYHREEGDRVYFRVDLAELGRGDQEHSVDIYVAVDCAPGGQSWLPDFVETRLPPGVGWEICVVVRDEREGVVYNPSFNSLPGPSYLGSYWSSELDAVEFGVSKSALVSAGWDGASPMRFWAWTTKDGTLSGPGELSGSDLSDFVAPSPLPLYSAEPGIAVLPAPGISSASTAGVAKYAVITHANQPIDLSAITQGYILTRHHASGQISGFSRMLDSHEMFRVPLNMHLSGTMVSSFLWAAQSPSDPEFPDRDGPSFLRRITEFATSGLGSLIGGVYAEHIMPYFEGEVNVSSMAAFCRLARHVFGKGSREMRVMHIPERVMQSDSGWVRANPAGPLRGLPFSDILAGGYDAAYLDEVTHLHWWFYPDQQENPGWDDRAFGRWSGYGGNDEEPYHHKIHKIHGVLVFMINDREDKTKFTNDDGGMAFDARHTLLGKALSRDQSQITVVFDDWEAYAGNSFGATTPNDNADRWHSTIRWVVNKPWIQVVNLVDVLEVSKSDASWVIDHGNPDGKSTQTYEWLKRAAENSYDNWYYGSNIEESFFDRVPMVSPEGHPPHGMKKYGDMNTPGTLVRDSWDKVSSMPPGSLRRLAEYAYSAMIYETAWHEEDAHPDLYRSRNYQVDFDRVSPGLLAKSDTTYDSLARWALRLHGHLRKVGVLAAAAKWEESVRSGTHPHRTVVEEKDIDDDTQTEYILRNERLFLCVERWGARIVAAFYFDPAKGSAFQVVGAPTAYNSAEHEGEGVSGPRCSAFKDFRVVDHPAAEVAESTPPPRTSSANDFPVFPHPSSRYVDMDYASTPPRMGSDFVEFQSKDGRVIKRLTLPSGTASVRGDYNLAPSIRSLHVRHGLGPNQEDLLLNGMANLESISGPSFLGLRNSSGGEAYVVEGNNSAIVRGPLEGAGYLNRALPLVEQVEVRSSEGSSAFSTVLSFSPQIKPLPAHPTSPIPSSSASSAPKKK